ncbi:hypothetical protein AR689_20840 [Arthrobacter sp. EpRS71]|nr:hypothetical protein AR689_20840 [Arthrobacter sp. EpRS71]
MTENLTGAETFLFVSGAQPERYRKAAVSGADVVIIDLEDAVPQNQKQEARLGAASFLAESRALVRINAVGTPHINDDAAVLADSEGLIGIMLPKAECLDDVEAAAAFFPGVPVVALIESARGLASAREIAEHPAVVRLAFGNLDFAADLGITPGAEEEELFYAFSHLVLASRLAGKTAPIAGVTPNFRDPHVAAGDARRQRAFGFGGKLLIHPAQIQPTVESFAPTSAELEWASRVIAASAAADGGAVQLEGAMVDRPVLLRAERIASRGTAI